MNSPLELPEGNAGRLTPRCQPSETHSELPTPER